MSAVQTRAPRPLKASLLVARALAEQIATMQPGDTLPPEKDLITEFGVGRSTMREALRVLEQQGVLTVKAGPRGGPVVSAPEPWALAQALSLRFQTEEITFREVIEARRVIEVAVARLAAEFHTDDDVEALRASVERMAEVVRDEEAFREENLTFHDCCAVAARSAVLQVFLASLRVVSDAHQIGVPYTPRRGNSVIEAHQKIVDAIAAGHGDAAAAAMDSHLKEFIEFMSRRYAGLLNRPVKWLLRGE